MKKLIVIICLLLLGTGIITIFWQQEIVYALPTPVPAGYNPLKTGQKLHLAQMMTKQNKPVFMHFFNPACPCSRFNMKHFKSLVREYGTQVEFRMVVQTHNTALTAEAVKEKYDLDIACVIDKDERIADACGVYSTPQAVILDKEGKLYYRGNYNRARYCTDSKSDFAKMAIDSLLKHNSSPVFGLLASRPYGCSLPTCQNNTNN
jgi:thioredoxin-related protein